MEKYIPAERNSSTEDIDRLTAELRKEPAVQQVFRVCGIPAQELEIHPYLISRWLRQKKLCSGCGGLKQCRQNQRGYAEELVYDGVLATELTPCAYLREKRVNEAHTVNFLINDLPETMRTAGFKDIRTEGESAAYLKALQRALTAFLNEESLYIYGNMGTGKTMLAACAVNDAARKGKKTVFLSMPRFADRIAASLRSGEYLTEIQRLCYADFVVMDDIGAESVTERMRSLLLSVLDTRMQEGRMTWFTSNEDFRSLQNHYILDYNKADIGDAERILERIRTIAEPLELIGRDRRNLHGKEIV